MMATTSPKRRMRRVPCRPAPRKGRVSTNLSRRLVPARQVTMRQTASALSPRRPTHPQAWRRPTRLILLVNTASSGSLTNPFQYTARKFDTETGLYYYRARYYDSIIGRFISEDPNASYNQMNLYNYVWNNPTNYVDPLGLYALAPGVPWPSPALSKLLTCMEDCIGMQIWVTSTTNGKHQDPGHAAGTSVDIRPPTGVSAYKVFCCAGVCGAAWGLNEGQGGQQFLYTQGYNYHLQLVPPKHPSPRAPNAIPPECRNGGCAARK
jgi:RHS repeat-associated protein